MSKRIVKIADLVNLSRAVDVGEDQQLMVRALNLKEMVTLFIESKDSFLPLYAAGLEGAGVESLAPFLLTTPELVAKIIALASDEPESSDLIQSRMPATVQLIALYEIWKASVPDPKKARELLSEVTALLQQGQKLAKSETETLEKSSPMTLLQP